MSNITTAAQFRTSIHGVFHGGSKHERHSAQVITVCHHTNKLNHVCSNKQDAYSAIPHLHRGLSNHISVMLVPTYCPLLTSSKKDSTTVWHSGAVSALSLRCRTAFCAQTGRSSGSQLHVRGRWIWRNTHLVLGYISKCTEDVTTTRTVKCYPNLETLAK